MKIHRIAELQKTAWYPERNNLAPCLFRGIVIMAHKQLSNVLLSIGFVMLKNLYINVPLSSERRFDLIWCASFEMKIEWYRVLGYCVTFSTFMCEVNNPSVRNCKQRSYHYFSIPFLIVVVMYLLCIDKMVIIFHV